MATWFRRLTDDDVCALRKMAELGASQAEIGHVMGVSTRTVNLVVNGLTHADLPTRPHRTKPLQPGSYRYRLKTLHAEVEALRRQLGQGA